MKCNTMDICFQAPKIVKLLTYSKKNDFWCPKPCSHEHSTMIHLRRRAVEKNYNFIRFIECKIRQCWSHICWSHIYLIVFIKSVSLEDQVYIPYYISMYYYCCFEMYFMYYVPFSWWFWIILLLFVAIT